MVKEGKILFKRSAEADKVPTAEQLDYGEIAMNYADGSEALFFKNSNNEIQKVNVNIDQKIIERSEKTIDVQKCIYIYFNTEENFPQNLINIREYETKLEELGFDMSKGYNIPYYSPDAMAQGYITKSKSGNYALNGSIFGQKPIIGWINYTNGQVSIAFGLMDNIPYNILSTSDKIITGAINELNSRLKKIEALLSGITSENN